MKDYKSHLLFIQIFTQQHSHREIISLNKKMRKQTIIGTDECTVLIKEMYHWVVYYIYAYFLFHLNIVGKIKLMNLLYIYTYVNI